MALGRMGRKEAIQLESHDQRQPNQSKTSSLDLQLRSSLNLQQKAALTFTRTDSVHTPRHEEAQWNSCASTNTCDDQNNQQEGKKKADKYAWILQHGR